MKESQILSFHNEKSMDMEVNSKRVPETFKVITPGKGKWGGGGSLLFLVELIKLFNSLNYMYV